jgi:lipopolysaccharide assembly outer membrane protein LptD (OstA)
VEEVVKIKTTSDPNANNFTDIEYSGFDLSGNRYVLRAGTADFKTEAPESINIKNVVANFYLKDGSILNVVSDEGLYNNKTLDMEFRKNVKSVYLDNTLLSEQLNYSNTDSKLLVSGNVRGESVKKGKFFADNVEYDLKDKTLDFSMFGNKQVKIKIKN